MTVAGTQASDPETLTGSLERAIDSDAGITFLDRHERPLRLTWAEINERARTAAGQLQALGVESGDRLGLIFPTCPEFVDVFLGALLAGAVPVPLYPPVRLGRLEEYQIRTGSLLKRVRAKVLLTDQRTRRILGESVEIAKPPLGCRVLEDASVRALQPVPVSAEDLALVQFSSGTTVEPKPVALDHRKILSQVRALNGFWPGGEGPRPSGVSWLPLYHDMGLVGCVLTALDYPGDLTLIPPELFVARPAVWMRTLSRTRATISPAPNFAYSLCVEKIHDEELEGIDLSNWRVALCGAETVVPEVLRAFSRRFASWGFRAEALSPVYGLSEATLAVTFSSLEEPFRSRRFSRSSLAAEGRAIDDREGLEIVSVGKPIPGFSVSVRDTDGSEKEAGEIGGVWVRGPSLMDGYLDESVGKGGVIRDGWLNTGDQGFFLDGELYLTGREKDVLIVRGRNHSPDEVESSLNKVVGVRTGCTAAVSHLEEGEASEALWVFVERQRSRAVEESELASACRDRILEATGLDADRVFILAPGTLPRTSSGKIRRQETLRLHLASQLDPPEPVHPLRLLRSLARSRTAMGRAERARNET